MRDLVEVDSKVRASKYLTVIEFWIHHSIKYTYLVYLTVPNLNVPNF